MRQATALVIGAGMGGLTAAAALAQRGWSVTVFERSDQLEPVGTAHALAPNAQRALGVLGLGEAVRTLSSWLAEGGVRTPSGRWLYHTLTDGSEERFGGPLVLTPSYELLKLLASLLPPTALRLGTSVRVLDPGDADRPARLRSIPCEGRGHRHRQVPTREWTADLVVAADGVHSATRRTLFPDHPPPRYVGLTSWRMLVDAPAGCVAAQETWGRGALWGTVPLRDGRLYAYGAAHARAGRRARYGERAELLRHFGSWHAPIPELISTVRPRDILRTDIHEADRPLPAYHRGRVALLGDSVHPMPPHLSQGGAQAIEDGVVLAHHARPAHFDPDRDLAAYSRDRLPRTTAVVRRAVRAGRWAVCSSPALCALRDGGVALISRLSPEVGLRGLDGIADWSPPPSPEDAPPPHEYAAS
ncbi:FAD-dependent oxidoreductase [Streptomyces sp. NPDC005438]|uniref:FAD-dependent oxidoreductase n=1 Tax=Streptomyces sp. NPDC005438 TaxID=3156880 RepID=UPI0033A0308B